MSVNETALVDRIGLPHSGNEIEVDLYTWRDRVYPPSLIGRTLAEELVKRPLSGKRVLDLGCGSGLIGISAALVGARVTCTDVSSAAVANTEHNARLNGVELETLTSDAFESLRGRSFDVIVANCPLPDTKLLEKALREGPEALTPDGCLLTWAASAFDFERIEAAMARSWSCLEVLREVKYDFHRIGTVDPAVTDVDELVRCGHLVDAGAQKISTARWYLLRNI